jgi:nicotinate (nicotinamide) nucleotide adenylyltransferase
MSLPSFPPEILRAKRLGFYGGSFDPPHRGHLFVARQALLAAKLDALLWVPARQSPHKAAGAVSGEVRAELVELCLADARDEGDPAADVAWVWRGELKRPEPSYTIHSIELLLAARRAYWGERGWPVESGEDKPLDQSGPGPEVFLVMGADQLDAIERWARVDELLASVQPLIIDRAEGQREARLAHLAACLDEGRLKAASVRRLKHGLLDTGRRFVSSTELRHALRDAPPAGVEPSCERNTEFKAELNTELTPRVRARILDDKLYP